MEDPVSINKKKYWMLNSIVTCFVPNMNAPCVRKMDFPLERL